MTSAFVVHSRERRIANAVREIRDLVDGDLDRQARTAAMLSGDLLVPDLEPDPDDPMSPKRPKPEPTEATPSTNVRLSRDLLDRADALAPLIAAGDPRLSAVAGADGLSRGAVLRLAIVEGLDVLEAKHLPANKRGGK